ncbi:MAG TPA: GNAT family N-acetyltransferase [Marmoricola sp.]
MAAWTIRPADEDDLAALAAIYDQETLDGYATFDTEPQGVAPFRARLEGADHLLVGCDGDQVLGYAYSAPFRTRGAYAATRETTVYLHPSAQGRGLGRALYDDLLTRLAHDRMHRAIAGIALPNPASIALHRACGFTEIGVFTEVGRKFDRWIDVAFYERSFIDT